MNPFAPMIVERGYLDHWKTNLLRQLTGLPNAAELPLRLWEHCEARMDDFIEDRDGLVIAGICRAPLEPKVLIVALTRCRWIEKKGGGFLVRGWRERQKGKFASRLNGVKGGRPKKDTSETHSQPGQNLQVSQTSDSRNLTEPIANPQGGERRGEEKRREPADPPLRASAPNAGVKVGISEERARIDRFMQQPAGSAWAYVAEQHLLALSPIPEDELAFVEWLYGQPASKDRPRLRSSPTQLLANWPDEVSKARRFASDRGVVVGPKKKESGAAAPPEGWQEIIRGILGDLPHEDFDRYPVDIRAQVLVKLAKP